LRICRTCNQPLQLLAIGSHRPSCHETVASRTDGPTSPISASRLQTSPWRRRGVAEAELKPQVTSDVVQVALEVAEGQGMKTTVEVDDGYELFLLASKTLPKLGEPEIECFL